MDKVYANPVGIIKKDIYIIRNNINGKVYIGQSQNAIRRFKEHCKPSNSNSIIGKAIQKYGKENFCKIIHLFNTFLNVFTYFDSCYLLFYS